MLRISRLTDYAVVIMAGLGRQPRAHKSASMLAEQLRLPEPTVSKILKKLAKEGLLESVRGINGGYCLTRAASAITMADIVKAMDGPIALTACTEGSGEECSLSGRCAMHGRWNPVNQAINAALEGVTLADMQTTTVSLNARPLGNTTVLRPIRTSESL